MTLKKSISKLLSNKITFYVVLVLSIINIIGYLAISNFNAIIFFALIGIISRQFSNNITVVLIIALIATSLLVSTKLIKEGMTSKKPKKVDEDEDDTKDANPNFNDSTKVKEAVHTLKQNDTKPKAKPVDIKKPTIVPSKPVKQSDSNVVVPLHNESFTSANKNGKKGGPRIDFASTLEDAYTNLDNMLGSDGIKNLSSDTKKLMGQQQNLFKSMESMTPLLGQAQEMLKTFDMKSITGLAGLADKLNKKKE